VLTSADRGTEVVQTLESSHEVNLLGDVANGEHVHVGRLQRRWESAYRGTARCGEDGTEPTKSRESRSRKCQHFLAFVKDDASELSIKT
jgi:hypothetical protein